MRRDILIVIGVILACILLGAGCNKSADRGPVVYSIVVEGDTNRVVVPPDSSRADLEWAMADIKKRKIAGRHFVFTDSLNATQGKQLATCDIGDSADSWQYSTTP